VLKLQFFSLLEDEAVQKTKMTTLFFPCTRTENATFGGLRPTHLSFLTVTLILNESA